MSGAAEMSEAGALSPQRLNDFYSTALSLEHFNQLIVGSVFLLDITT
jgi:hypothetical protein